MSGIRTNNTWAPVPSAVTEIAPVTMIGQFSHSFDGAGPMAQAYIRPGNQAQQDYPNIDGAEWVLYTRSIMSYAISWRPTNGALGGATLVVQIGSLELAGNPIVHSIMPFHIVGENDALSCQSNIELPGVLARFAVFTNNVVVGGECTVFGSIVVRAI